MTRATGGAQLSAMCSRDRGRTSAAVGLYGALKPALLQWEVWERECFEEWIAGSSPAIQ